MLQNIRLQRNGRRSPRSENIMNDSCVKIYLYLEGHEREISFILANFCFTHDHENFEMCHVLNANYGL